jgi:hypothetical protein
MDTNKIIRSGFIFFAVVLFALAFMKYMSNYSKAGAFYLIGSIGFLTAYISFGKKRKKGS